MMRNLRSPRRMWLVGIAAAVLVSMSVSAQTDIQSIVDSAYAEFRNLKEGKNADYIPALAKDVVLPSGFRTTVHMSVSGWTQPYPS